MLAFYTFYIKRYLRNNFSVLPGMRQSSKMSSEVFEPLIPILSNFFPTEKPGVLVSTIKAVTPWAAFDVEESVFA